MTRILLTETAYERLEPRLAALAGHVDCVVMDDKGAVRPGNAGVSAREAAPQCAYLSGDVFTKSLTGIWLNILLQSPALEWVQSAGAGLDHPMFVRLAEKGVRLTTNHTQAIAIAEYVLWGVLNHFQHGKMRSCEQAAHRWTPLTSREIRGTSWLIVGFGAIGQAVARLAKGFGAHVTGVRRSPGPSPLPDRMITPDQILHHLPTSDVVLLCMPQTRETLNLVDARFLEAMKDRSVLVNVGRGGLVDESALLRALDSGPPEHALLDVFRTEPLPADSSLWDHPRVDGKPCAPAAMRPSRAFSPAAWDHPGEMFAFLRNRLVGSYLRLSATRRS